VNLQTIFGRYISRDSVVHSMDPRAKLLLSILFMVVVFAAQSYVALAVAAVFTFGMFFFAKISIKQAFVSIAPLAILVVFTGLLNIFFVQGGQIYFQFGIICISEQGLNQCLFIVIRLTLLLLGMSLLTLSTTTLNITDGFEELLKPFKRFGVPAHELATMMGIALRFLPQFATELQTIYRAQVSRGANFKTNARGTFSMMVALIVPLFTSAFRHAETLSLGMDARCYHGGTNRTSLHELRFQKCDLGGLLYLICGLACVILVNIVMGYFGL
jgi:energy-coupling factor transport system permease protein